MLTLLAQVAQEVGEKATSNGNHDILIQYGLPILGTLATIVITAKITTVLAYRKFRREQLWQSKTQKYDETISLLYD